MNISMMIFEAEVAVSVVRSSNSVVVSVHLVAVGVLLSGGHRGDNGGSKVCSHLS